MDGVGSESGQSDFRDSIFAGATVVQQKPSTRDPEPR
jgi:hypothetical protein